MTGGPLGLVRPYRWTVAGRIAIVTVSAAAEAAGLILLSSVLASLVPGSVSGAAGPLAGLARDAGRSPTLVLIALAAVYVGKSLLALWSTYASFTLGLRMADDWSLRLLRGYLSAPLGRVTRQQGSMLHMVLGETGLVGGGLATGGLLAQNALSAASVYVALLLLSPVLTLGLTVMAAAATVAIVLLSRYAQRISARRTLVADDAYSYITETLGALKQLRLFGLEAEAARRVGDHLIRLRRLQRTSSVIASSPRLLIEIIFLLGLAALLGVLTPTIGGGTTLADVGLVAAAAFRLLPSVSATAGTWVQLQQAMPGLERIARELGHLEARDDLDRTGGDRPATFAHSIALEEIRFAYPGRERALAGVRLEIPRGSFIGVVGPSGSGKSTLVDLLCGFYVPDAGRILVDGVDLREIDLQRWRRQLGVVAQDTFLFSGSLRENLRLLRPDADDAAIERVVEMVGADAFIAELPEGYATRVGERGLRLSGGQRQRLALARVLLRAPEVLILDEATSALDVASDELIRAHLQRLRGAMTMIVVAHRLSAVRGADRIYVLAGGRVIEEGTHDELVEADGAYAAMWRSTGSGIQASPAEG